MNNQDPNTWTPQFVSRYTSECLYFLRETNMMVVELLKQREYEACIAGLDRIINGLIVMQNSNCGDFRAHICMLSWCEGNIIAMGVNAPERNRRETAIMMYQDAYDFAKTESSKENLQVIIDALEGGISLQELKEEMEPDFPNETLDILDSITERF